MDSRKDRFKSKWFVAALFSGLLLVSGMVASQVLQAANASTSTLTTSNSVSTQLSSATTLQNSGSYIINYIYEIETGKSVPRLSLVPSVITQGSSLTVNGTNLSINSTANVSIFNGQPLSLQDRNGTSTNSAALLMTGANVTVSQSGNSAMIQNRTQQANSQSTNGTAYIVTKIFSSDIPAGTYNISLDCSNNPNGASPLNLAVQNSLVVNASGMKQYFKLSLPVGDYNSCRIAISSGGITILQSTALSFKIVADDTAKDTVATDSKGGFLQQVNVDDMAVPGKYVLMAESAGSNNNTQTVRAIAPLTISSGSSQTTTSSSSSSEIVSSLVSLSASTTNTSVDNSNSGGVGVGSGSAGGGQSEPSNSTSGITDNGNAGDNGDATGSGSGSNPGQQSNNDCTPASNTYSNVNNVENQFSSQTSRNNSTDTPVVTVIQKIEGTPSGAHVTNSVHVNNINTVMQTVNQTIHQTANIENCGSGSASNLNFGANSLDNSILMNASQSASNVFTDDSIIIIKQTIIIPESCNTDVSAPVTVNNDNNINQKISQTINQNANIKYGGGGSAGSGSSTTQNTNTITQVSIQVSNNTGSSKPVYTLNQLIIVPQSCPASVSAPIVLNNINNVTESISQVTNQNATINANGNAPPSGVTILSTVAGGNQSSSNATNTVTMIALQNATNSFTNSPQITIQQSVYYVNSTSGYTPQNYQTKLSQEFGNSTGESNSTSGTTGSNSKTNLSGNQTGGNFTSSTPADQGGGSSSTTINTNTVAGGHGAGNSNPDFDEQHPDETTGSSNQTGAPNSKPDTNSTGPPNASGGGTSNSTSTNTNTVAGGHGAGNSNPDLSSGQTDGNAGNSSSASTGSQTNSNSSSYNSPPEQIANTSGNSTSSTSNTPPNQPVTNSNTSTGSSSTGSNQTSPSQGSTDQNGNNPNPSPSSSNTTSTTSAGNSTGH